MKLLKMPRSAMIASLSTALFLATSLLAQDGPPPDRNGPPGGGPGGPGRPGGFGGGPGMNPPEIQLLRKFDQDGSKFLDASERKTAREFLAKERTEGRGRPRGPGRRVGGGETQAVEPGPRITPDQIKSGGKAGLYDTGVLRTLFLTFEDADWEKALADFNNTDVEIPADVLVDGNPLRHVGVSFRGASSYFTVPEGRKRSLNLSVDSVHADQKLLGFRSLNLLNAHVDPSFLRSVLYFGIARDYLPAARANYVHVVINGESWGVYVNVEQFNKDFIRERFGTADGARWKVQGSPNGRGTLAYLGEEAEAYRKAYSLKSKDSPASWQALARLCKTLNQTSPDRLEAELAPILDVEGALRFLALENVMVNNDGYWIRASDYNLYLDTKGRFHILPHDSNETFYLPGGPGFGGGRGGGDGGIQGVELPPLYGSDNPDRPLISKLLAVPALRTRYLAIVREMAEKSLDWTRLAPVAKAHQALIRETLKTDTRKLSSIEDFEKNLTATARGGGSPGPDGGRGIIGIQEFVEQRRAYLMRVTAASAAPK